MNQRVKRFAVARFLAAASITAICFGVLWYLISSSRPISQVGIDSKASVETFTRAPNLARQSNSNPAALDPLTNLSAAQREWVIDRGKRVEAWTDSKNVAIDFWGQVVDQDNQPLSGVKIEASTREWSRGFPLSLKSKFPTNHFVSDQLGQFSIHNMRGDSLVLERIQKDGYELATNQPTIFGYGTSEQYRADASRPVVYHMWKLRGAEPTIDYRKHVDPSADGVPVFVNLVTGEMGKNVKRPDLRIAVKRTPVFRPGGDTGRFDWRIELEAVNGGLQVSESIFMYWAPESNYQSQWHCEYLKDAPDWVDARVVRLYLRTRDGNYARITLSFRAWATEDWVGLTVDSYLNPSGSRNLEFDARMPAPRPD